MARRLPSNVERADLIQVGLIAVAQAALSFEWEGDRETEEAREAFVRYARQRVKGAMLDELRQMDHLGRAQRRQVKVIQVAKERWRGAHGGEPTTAQLAEMSGLSMDEVFDLELAAHTAHTQSLSDPSDAEDAAPAYEPSTERDEVEARVDTGMLMRRLEPFFATLPDRDRQIIDAYLGIGMSPVKLAESMNISPSRVSQLFGSICERIEVHQGHARTRSTDRTREVAARPLDDLITRREHELGESTARRPWGAMFEDVLTAPTRPPVPANEERIVITSGTRWG